MISRAAVDASPIIARLRIEMWALRRGGLHDGPSGCEGGKAGSYLAFEI